MDMIFRKNIQTYYLAIEIVRKSFHQSVPLFPNLILLLRWSKT